MDVGEIVWIWLICFVELCGFVWNWVNVGFVSVSVVNWADVGEMGWIWVKLGGLDGFVWIWVI